MKLKRTSKSAAPITLAQARSQLRIIPFGDPLAHPDDAYIQTLIDTATTWCEQYTGVELYQGTYEVVMDDFPLGDIRLPISPVTAITSIVYKDASGIEQTLSNTKYTLDTYGASNLIYLTNGNTYPDVFDEPNAVKITLTAGVVAPESPILHAIKLIITNYYENRQEDQMSSARLSFNSLPMGVKELLQPYRVELGF